MKLTYRWILVAVVVIVALLLGLFIHSLLDSSKSTGVATLPKVGLVKMEKVISFNPAYEDYTKAKKELEDLQAKYKSEQQTLTLKSQEQSLALQSLGSDKEITDLLNTELMSKVKAKEQELNIAYQKQRIALIAKYRSELKTDMTEADLRIVNLQLELSSNTQPLAFTDEQKARLEAERAAKEEELKALLAQRSQSIESNDIQVLEQKVDGELSSLRAAGQKELDEYAANLQKELLARRDEMMKAKADSILATNNLPNPVDWNSTWDSRLKAKQSEVDALHDAILEDVRMRAMVVAKERNLDLIVINEVSNVNAVDVTDAIIASYSAAQ